MQEEFIPTAKAELTEYGWRVSVTWMSPTHHIDRTGGAGWQLGTKHQKLAERLVRAVNAGAVLQNPTLKVDVNGNTYVEATSSVLGRTLNSDLNRLGF